MPAATAAVVQKGDKTDAVMELAKRRGYLWPAFEVYGGAAGFYDYGPLGAAMKKRFEDLWRHVFVRTEATPMAEIFCPRVTPEEVLVASGHVAEFTDMVVKCAKGHPSRADHLVAAAGYTGNAGVLKAAELDEQIARLKAKCPVCGETKFSNAARQNLMNQTEIGPGSGRVGYLRPETAQGIFTDYPLLFRHFRERLPFGVVMLGGSNRNEISPRQGMLRLREFSMMEAEVFYDPEAKTHPRFHEVRDRKATFVPNSDEKDHEMTFGQAVSKGMVANEALAYWLARTQEFLLAAGMDPRRLHFRQHLKNEMAHYAADCWDAEFHSERYGWVECVGIADRGSYDLTQHAKFSGTDFTHPISGVSYRLPNAEFLRYWRRLLKVEGVDSAEAVVEAVANIGIQEDNLRSYFQPSKKFFPTFKAQAKAIQWAMSAQSPYIIEIRKQLKQLDVDTTVTGIPFDEVMPLYQQFLRMDEKIFASGIQREGPLTVHLPSGPIEVPADCIQESKIDGTVLGVKSVPCVIEPSFGVDRILYALWEHAHEAGEKNGEPYVRLRLSRKVAPVQVAVLPLTNKDNLPEKAEELEWTLRAAGLATDRDESGNIGRRYARQDEAGTPLCVTVDNETLQDGAVTVRDRDTMEQVRVPIARLVEHLRFALNG